MEAAERNSPPVMNANNGGDDGGIRGCRDLPIKRQRSSSSRRRRRRRRRKEQESFVAEMNRGDRRLPYSLGVVGPWHGDGRSRGYPPPPPSTTTTTTKETDSLRTSPMIS